MICRSGTLALITQTLTHTLSAFYSSGVAAIITTSVSVLTAVLVMGGNCFSTGSWEP